MARSPRHPSLGPASVAPTVLRHGHAVLHLGYGSWSVPWSHTVGLTASGRPELVVLGLDLDSSHELLNALATEAAAHGLPSPEVSFERNGLRIKLVETPDDWVLTDPDRMAGWFAYRAHEGTTWPALPSILQVVWAGADGRFPDDATAVAANAGRQPVLRDDPFSLPLVA